MYKDFGALPSEPSSRVVIQNASGTTDSGPPIRRLQAVGIYTPANITSAVSGVGADREQRDLDKLSKRDRERKKSMRNQQIDSQVTLACLCLGKSSRTNPFR